jgi:hypothetical protein
MYLNILLFLSDVFSEFFYLNISSEFFKFVIK